MRATDPDPAQLVLVIDDNPDLLGLHELQQERAQATRIQAHPSDAMDRALTRLREAGLAPDAIGAAQCRPREGERRPQNVALLACRTLGPALHVAS